MPSLRELVPPDHNHTLVDAHSMHLYDCMFMQLALFAVQFRGVCVRDYVMLRACVVLQKLQVCDVLKSNVIPIFVCMSLAPQLSEFI